MSTNVTEVIAAIARNVRFGDNGDRNLVAEFCDRNPEAVDAFGPLTDENRAIRDDRDDDANDDNDPTDDKTGTASDKPGPSHTPGSTANPGPA